MKREIKFRGLRKDGKGWSYGMPSHDFKYVFGGGQYDSPDNYEVIPETVGQYTGLKNKRGREIYEGDIIKVSFIEEGKSPVCFFYKVEYKDFGFQLHHTLVDKNWGSLSRLFELRWETEIEVIGNIHENKELI